MAKKSPQDATMRNVRKSRKDTAAIEQRLKALEKRVSALEKLIK